MTRRSDVLKPFEQKKAFMEDRVRHGIEQNRKGTASLHFKDAEGREVNGAHIEIRQKAHDFHYGAVLPKTVRKSTAVPPPISASNTVKRMESNLKHTV